MAFILIYGTSLLRVNFWDLLFSHLKLRENLGSKLGYAHGTHCLNLWIGLGKASLVYPLWSAKDRNPLVNSLALRFVYGN